MTTDYLFLWSSYVAGKSVPTLWLRWPEASYSHYSIHIRLFIRISSWKGKECPFQYMSDICKAMSKGYGAILIRNLKVDQIIHIIPFDHDRLFIRISSCSRSIFKSFVVMKNEGMSGTCRVMMSKAYGGNQIDQITTDHKLRANNKHTRCKVWLRFEVHETNNNELIC